MSRKCGRPVLPWAPADQITGASTRPSGKELLPVFTSRSTLLPPGGAGPAALKHAFVVPAGKKADAGVPPPRLFGPAGTAGVPRRPPTRGVHDERAAKDDLRRRPSCSALARKKWLVSSPTAGTILRPLVDRPSASLGRRHPRLVRPPDRRFAAPGTDRTGRWHAAVASTTARSGQRRALLSTACSKTPCGARRRGPGTSLRQKIHGSSPHQSPVAGFRAPTLRRATPGLPRSMACAGEISRSSGRWLTGGAAAARAPGSGAAHSAGHSGARCWPCGCVRRPVPFRWLWPSPGAASTGHRFLQPAIARHAGGTSTS